MTLPRLSLLILLLSTSALTAAPTTSPASFPSPARAWLDYEQNPDAHPNLANFSYAGYAYGERPLPDLPVVVKASDLGARADGKTDATAALNAAIQAAHDKGGGAVLLDAGTYLLSGVLWMHHDGVVLRGQGSPLTRLSFTRPLNDAVGPNAWGSKSAWSWSGGMIWFAPPSLRGPKSPPLSRGTEGWPDAGLAATVTADASRGQRTLTLDNAADLRPGQRILLQQTDPGDASLFSHLCGDIPGTAQYNWKSEAASLFEAPDYRWPVEIASVEANRITLRQPLRADVRAKWHPKIFRLGAVVRDSGVEGLTLQMAPARLSAHLENPGWNGLCFENAWDCWARDIIVRDVDNGLGTIASKCITLDAFAVEGRDCHHATYCRAFCADILFTRFSINAKCHHGINVEGLSSGNVWSAVDMAHGTFDSHRALPFDNLRTDITIFNDGGHGGAGDAGPLFGARFCHWNIRVLNARPEMIHVAAMMPRGAVVGVQGVAPYAKPYPDFPGDQSSIVQSSGPDPTAPFVAPRDLHVAQLALRTGQIPAHLGRPIQLTLARTDGRSLHIAWDETFTTARAYELSRRIGDKPWDPLAQIEGPAHSYDDSSLAPAQSYAYRIRSLVAGQPSAWSTSATLINTPPPLRDLAAAEVPPAGQDPIPAHGRPWQSGGVRLTWSKPEGTAGTILIQRRPASAPDTTWQTLAEPNLSTSSYLDTTASPGLRYLYRLRITDASGQGPESQADLLTRAAGTMVLHESFDTARPAALPAKSDGPASLGTWLWSGLNRDNRPSLSRGTLTWPITRSDARSFVRTLDFTGDLSAPGAAIEFDYTVGSSSGHNVHTVEPCLRLADGRWISTPIAYTQTQKNLPHHQRFDLSTADWRLFNPDTLTTSDQKPPAPFDLSHVTAVGLQIGRPINNRTITFETLFIWGRDLRVTTPTTQPAP